MKRVRLLISGRVQGVAFRYACEEEAVARGVSGWVRNLSDGRVEAELEGQDADVEAVVEWSHAGPPAAWVESVEVTAIPQTGEGGFQIR